MLTDEQQRAYTEIHQSFTSHNITLLHGVTSSGKTSIYIHLIQDALAKGKQALYLVPEIALTTQLTQRLQKVLGEQLLIYHSRFSDNERVDIWRRLLDSNEPMVVIGVRSAVFLPFSNLGLVIVDEEHDSSYKQQDPAPRYNGRNVAIVLAQMHGAKTLLGSATPAIESYYNASQGKYGLVSLLSRYENIKLPQVEETAKLLIEVMPLMFIPAGVALLESWGDLKPILIPVAVIMVVSTVLVMGVSGKVTQGIMSHAGKKQKEEAKDHE